MGAVLRRRSIAWVAASACGALLVGACGDSESDSETTVGITSAGQSTTDSVMQVTMSASASTDGAATESTDGVSTGAGTSTGVASDSVSSSGSGSTTFPATSAGETEDPDTTTGVDPCGNSVLSATIRDFSLNHPDFESFTGDTPYLGIVAGQLGGDDKPVYNHPGATPQTSGPDNFAHWYNDTPGVNIPFEIEIVLEEVEPGLFRYENSAFFPIDDSGFGNEGWFSNFHFTTEIHTTFKYSGGELFTFTGDDDLWLFLNGKLAIDLGGTHPPESSTVDLDAQAGALGLVPGGVYTMDIFHAERHTDQSNFRIDTTIGCFIPG